MRYKLMLDIDSRDVERSWKDSMQRIYRVYYTKRMYLPVISVERAVRSRKGWHIYATFIDGERILSEPAYRMSLLLIQCAFGSDSTRALFDYLRVCRGEARYNLLFNYKNGRAFKEDHKMKDILQKIADKARAFAKSKRIRYT